MSSFNTAQQDNTRASTPTTDPARDSAIFNAHLSSGIGIANLTGGAAAATAIAGGTPHVIGGVAGVTAVVSTVDKCFVSCHVSSPPVEPPYKPTPPPTPIPEAFTSDDDDEEKSKKKKK